MIARFKVKVSITSQCFCGVIITFPLLLTFSNEKGRKGEIKGHPFFVHRETRIENE